MLIDLCLPSLKLILELGGTTTNDSVVVINAEKFSKNRDSIPQQDLVRGDMVATEDVNDISTS
eukprot:CAMPEP_0168283040 /NCGR_PEP_ID=MMETSP0141_2-20121125/22703_1 /TAXON_ID=44445 /ORGANISM="Pseudo-nitzschia australis, Strain 10249 10 AB" /LENGTH=62 /DNA_ID=CAMNT_0008226835 /DNA_START=44 /DNA_END=229 /DNA_ORIENTATION=+